jgi:hypothetical protein
MCVPVCVRAPVCSSGFSKTEEDQCKGYQGSDSGCVAQSSTLSNMHALTTT